MDIIGIRHHAVGVGGIVAINVAAQHGQVDLPVTLVAQRLGHGKAAIQGHTAFQLKG